MFGRRSVRSVGDYMRLGLEPMAQRLGVDYDESFFSPRQTPEARVFDAYRVGQSLLMFLSYPEGWLFGPNPSKKLAKRAARAVHDSLVTESGRSAISHMTQGYAREMAALWRRAADEGGPDVIPEQLTASARRSAELGTLAARFWRAEDPYGALDKIALYEGQRVADPDNPDAMIDMRGYYGTRKCGLRCGLDRRRRRPRGVQPPRVPAGGLFGSSSRFRAPARLGIQRRDLAEPP